jgi:aminoacyl-tRNA hydrolase
MPSTKSIWGSTFIKRSLSRVPDPVVYGLLRPAALAWRHTIMRHVTVVGVTGSSGKTTTKFLLAAAVNRHFGATASPGNLNSRHGVCWALFHSRPWKRMHVQEIAIGRAQSSIQDLLSVARPGMAVVTSIGADHLSAYGSLDAIAAEKSKLVAAVPPGGMAVLNADDPRVMAMAAVARCRVVTYGLSPGATLRAGQVRGEWPDRLSFEVQLGNEHCHVATRLLGRHQLHTALAALAAATAAGVPLEVAAAAMAEVDPIPTRMQPVESPDGVTFVRDDIKAPLHSIEACLSFMRGASAARKVMVFGTISDYSAKPAAVYSRIAEHALDVADLVVFVGPRAGKCLAARKHPKGDALHAFFAKEAAGRFLATALKPGDLVLLKGSAYADRLGSLTEVRIATGGTASAEPVRAPGTAGPESLVIVGLGNAREALRNTPHSVGAEAVRTLAQTHGASWRRSDLAQTAQIELNGRPAHLVMLDTVMNRSGPALRQLCERLGSTAAQLVVVLDDVSLAPGTVRIRSRGGDGGHRGLRSIIEAFGTDEITRIRIGVGAPESRADLATYVLSPMPSHLRRMIEAAHGKVQGHLAGMLQRPAA